jgi:hypothetical protein
MRKLILIALTAALAACSGADDPIVADDTNKGQDMAADMPANDMGAGPDMTADQGLDMPAAGYAGLVINEVAAAGEPSDWFELYNGGAATIDLSGVTFSDDDADRAKGKIAAGTTLAPGAYLAVDVSDEAAGFKLSSDERLGLYAPSGAPIDLIDWEEGSSPAGKSLGRIPNGAGPFVTLDVPTRGAANVPNGGAMGRCGDGVVNGAEVCDGAALSGQTCEGEGFASGSLACAASCAAVDTSGCVAKAARVVISEVTSSGDDQIELFNAGDAPAALSGWRVVDSGYDLMLPADDVDNLDQSYTLPATMLMPGAYLVLVKDADHSFGLGKSDEVLLLNAASEVVDRTGVWPDDEAETSWCRAGELFQACQSATFGAANRP